MLGILQMMSDLLMGKTFANSGSPPGSVGFLEKRSSLEPHEFLQLNEAGIAVARKKGHLRMQEIGSAECKMCLH